jgi:biotin synthase
MIRDETLTRILSSALEEKAPSKEDALYLLGLPEVSLQAAALRGVADHLCRSRFKNQAIILGQIGVETSPCPGGCKFCVFGEGHALFDRSSLTAEEVLCRAEAFTSDGSLFALFLMTMHDYVGDKLLNLIDTVRRATPSRVQIVVNIGDFDAGFARSLREVGVSGAYHVLRMREGTDTALDPEKRKATIRTIKDAGIDWYYCCEPIGPEHTNEELVEQMWLGVDYGCFQHAAMRRVYQTAIPLHVNGQITELRLAQITAVVQLVSMAGSDTRSVAVHEPNLIGLTSGANAIYAETGANPRDVSKDTSGARGLDLAGGTKMLYEAGFSELLRGDFSACALSVLGVEATPV